LTIGAGAQIAAGSGLMHDVPPGERWAGFPAQPAKEWMRAIAIFRRAPRQGAARGQERVDAAKEEQ
jgi:UDP-3-O-[3-hydroxymyristoyl] glucosamine N-acyltransferase